MTFFLWVVSTLGNLPPDWCTCTFSFRVPLFGEPIPFKLDVKDASALALNLLLILGSLRLSLAFFGEV